RPVAPNCAANSARATMAGPIVEEAMLFRGDDAVTFFRRRRELLAVAALLAIALVLRVFQVNWDQGHLYHPDERFILMSAAGISLAWPLTFDHLVGPQASLLPQDYSFSY